MPLSTSLDWRLRQLAEPPPAMLKPGAKCRASEVRDTSQHLLTRTSDARALAYSSSAAFDLKFLNELAASPAGTSNRRRSPPWRLGHEPRQGRDRQRRQDRFRSRPDRADDRNGPAGAYRRAGSGACPRGPEGQGA